jgi:ribosomal protein S12 methylthiotransferase
VQRFYVETLGCPKNDVDSDKLIGALVADGMIATDDASIADLVVVNTCAFIGEARQESVDTILALAEQRSGTSRLVVTGCMAERYGDELAQALPEVDQVAGFGQAFNLIPTERDGSEVPHGTAPARKLIPVSSTPLPAFDLLNLPRPKSTAPWAYVKIAEGCDRSCGFCAIPGFRGPQRSRDVASILTEVDETGAREIVLVAQDLASYGKDRPDELGAGSIVPLVDAVAAAVDRVRLLYLYPSDLSDALIDSICNTGVPYFDLSLQHVSKPLLRRMRRWGDGQRFLDRIADIRRREPDAAFRSNFIVGYPGETEEDHDQLLDFVEASQLDWCGFFAYSNEDGTYAADLDRHVEQSLMNERLAELREIQDDITATRRDALIGRTVDVLVDANGVGRSHREAPEIDGVIHLPTHLPIGDIVSVEIVDALGPDLVAAGVRVASLDGDDADQGDADAHESAPDHVRSSDGARDQELSTTSDG